MANVYESKTEEVLKSEYSRVINRIAWLDSTIVNLQNKIAGFQAEKSGLESKIVAIKKDFIEVDKVSVMEI